MRRSKKIYLRREMDGQKWEDAAEDNSDGNILVVARGGCGGSSDATWE